MLANCMYSTVSAFPTYQVFVLFTYFFTFITHNCYFSGALLLAFGLKDVVVYLLLDVPAASCHQVFKRISNLAVRAIAHFQLLQAAQRALEPTHVPAASTGQPSGAAARHDDVAGEGRGDSTRPSTGLALECLLLWLACYDDLFQRPCDVSGKLIAWEPATAVPLPPILRPYW